MALFDCVGISLHSYGFRQETAHKLQQDIIIEINYYTARIVQEAGDWRGTQACKEKSCTKVSMYICTLSSPFMATAEREGICKLDSLFERDSDISACIASFLAASFSGLFEEEEESLLTSAPAEEAILDGVGLFLNVVPTVIHHKGAGPAIWAVHMHNA